MLHFLNPADARAWCNSRREAGQTVGFVPTMGALHQGHLSLIERAQSENDVSCASIFVNPLQFEEGKDFASYPRDLEADLALLETHGCDMIFEGSLESFFRRSRMFGRYPYSQQAPLGKDSKRFFVQAILTGSALS